MTPLLLALLAVQNCAMGFLLNARPRTPEAFSPSSVIFVSEVLKLAVSSLLVVFVSRPKDVDAAELKRVSNCRYIWLRCTQSGFWLMAVVAAMFVVQGNLKLFSAPLLTPTTFQVLQESKLIFVIIASIVVLRVRVTPAQWLAVFTMLAAIMLMQSRPADRDAPPSSTSTAAIVHPTLDRQIGTIGMLLVGTIGAFASVLIERAMRTADTWVVNTQLSFFSLLPAAAPLVASGRFDILHGFNLLAWATVLNLAFGGILVALVIKKCGNIAKTFTTPLAIVLSYLISVTWMATPWSWPIAGACVMAVCSILLYNFFKPEPVSVPTIRVDEESSDEKGFLLNPVDDGASDDSGASRRGSREAASGWK